LGFLFSNVYFHFLDCDIEIIDATKTNTLAVDRSGIFGCLGLLDSCRHSPSAYEHHSVGWPKLDPDQWRHGRSG
jgi:hypothetical protein